MAAPTHYPLSFGRILSLGWSLFQYAWRPLIGAAALCLVPVYALMVPVTAAFSPLINGWTRQAQQAQLQGQQPPPLPAGAGMAFFSLLLMTLLLLLASLLATAAMTRVVDRAYRAQPIGTLEAVRNGLGRLTALVVANLLFFVAFFLILVIGLTVGATLFIGGGLATFLGLVALVSTFAALIFVGMRTSLVAPVVVVDRSGGADALVRSWRLTSGSGWRVLGYLIVVGLLEGGPGLLLVGVPALLLRLSDTASMDVAVGTVLNGAISILLASIGPILVTLLYYDLRWRAGETVPVPGGGEASAAGLMAPNVPPGPPPL